MKTCLLKVPCRCGHQRGIITAPTGTIHAGRIDCADCSGFLKWLSKADLDIATEKGLVNSPLDNLPLFG